MVKEYETKVLEVNVSEIKKKLRSLGAKEKHKEVLMRRWVFDIGSKNSEWIRLRDDGKSITLTYKRKNGSAISETEEIEIAVSNFEEAAQILMKLKFKNKYYQENKRITFILNDIQFMIDTWPMIPVYLEVESSSENKVQAGLKLLGLDGSDAGNLSSEEVYSRYGISLHKFKVLKFS